MPRLNVLAEIPPLVASLHPGAIRVLLTRFGLVVLQVFILVSSSFSFHFSLSLSADDGSSTESLPIRVVDVRSLSDCSSEECGARAQPEADTGNAPVDAACATGARAAEAPLVSVACASPTRDTDAVPGTGDEAVSNAFRRQLTPTPEALSQQLSTFSGRDALAEAIGECAFLFPAVPVYNFHFCIEAGVFDEEEARSDSSSSLWPSNSQPGSPCEGRDLAPEDC